PGRHGVPDDDDEVREDRGGAREEELRRAALDHGGPPERHARGPARLRDADRRRSEALEVLDGRAEGRGARRGVLRRPLLPGSRPDRPLAGGGGGRPGGETRGDLLRGNVGPRDGVARFGESEERMKGSRLMAALAFGVLVGWGVTLYAKD